MLLLLSLRLFVLLYTVNGDIQHAFKTHGSKTHLTTFSSAFENYDTGLFTAIGDLNLLSTETSTTLKHPLFPTYSVRVKKSTDFCDGTVNAYTGYIDIEARHIFFYFFESRNEPDKDDVIFWTNGGPACSSSMGLFMELGPCRVQDVNTTKFNPYAWNEKANVFFVDQPVGAGFSYADHGETVSTTEEAAEDIAAFVAIFFQHFIKFAGRGLHLAGESYGGRFIPVFASKIYDQNSHLVEAGFTAINLTSIMIGNGCVDQSTLFRAYYEIQCTNASISPINSISNCVQMRQLVPRCEKWYKESCYDMMDAIACRAAFSYCYDTLETFFATTRRNPYDISKYCEGEHDDTLCYPITKEITAFLNRLDIRETLGVDSLVGNFTPCNMHVVARFGANLDQLFPTQYYIAALLERGVRALVYVGANDLVCSWVGNNRMTLEMDWTGKNIFNAQDLREWRFNGAAVGLTRRAGPLTFATIYGAGHMVPYDKPEASLELVKRWLAGDDL
ncbi:unnamed protein product [Somion occarium]|uniref:Carboxypeptidase n=1 Tax=Somion occarium TaxID=3059160 RepID=A0ABP1DZA8_9APHY